VIDSKDEYEDVKKLLAEYEKALEKFKGKPAEKPRVDAIRAEMRELEKEIRDYDKRQKEMN
jgi:hypothetical protein